MSAVDRSALKPHWDSLDKLLQSVEDHTSKDLTNNVQKGDSPVVVTVTPVLLVLIEPCGTSPSSQH